MEKNNQPRKLDSAKLASIDILKLNNKVVLMRPAYKIAKDSTIQYRRKVLRKMVNRNSRRAEDKLEQYKLRVERIQEEINIMKQIRPNNAIKYALANTSTYSEVLSQPNITLETKCLAKIADHPKMKEVVAKFRKKHSDWKALAEFLLNHIPRRFHRNKYMDEQRKMRINFKVGNQLVKSYIKSKVGTDHTLTEQNTDTKLSVQEKITKQFQEDKEIPAKKTTTNNRNELSDESEDSDLEDSLNIDKDANEDNSEDEKSEVGSDGEVCAEPYIKQEKKSVSKVQPYIKKEKESTSEESIREEVESESEVSNEPYIKQEKKSVSKVQPYIKKEKESTSEESIREEVESESEVSNEPYIKQEKKSVSKVQPYIKKEKESTSEESIKEEVESESEVSNELYIKQEKKSVSKVQPYIKKEKESTSEESIKEEVESESEVSNEESEHNKSESKSDTKVKGEMVVKKLKIDAFTDSEDIEVPAFLVCQEDRATTVQHKKSKDSFFMFGEEDNENSNDNTSSNGNGSEMDNDDDNEVNTTRKNTLKSTFVGSLNDGSSRGWGQFNRFGHDRGPFQNFERRGNEHFTDKFSRDHQKAPREFQRSGQRGQGYRSFDNRENKIGQRGQGYRSFDNRENKFGQRGQGYRSFDNRGNKFGQRGQGYRSFDNRENKFGQRGRNISRSFSNREFQGSGHRGRGYNQSFNGGEVHGYGRSEGGYQRSFGDRQNYSGFQGQRKEYPKSSTEFKDSSKRSDKIHPSWEASKKRKQQQATINTFQGKKIKFDD